MHPRSRVSRTGRDPPACIPLNPMKKKHIRKKNKTRFLHDFLPHKSLSSIPASTIRSPTHNNVGLTFKALKYFRINHGDQRYFFQFQIIINV